MKAAASAVVSDDFLGDFASGGRVLSFAEMSCESALSAVEVIGFVRKGGALEVDEISRNRIVHEVAAWLPGAGPAVPDLMAKIVHSRLDGSGERMLCLPMPSGRQLAFVPADLLVNHGAERIAREAHRKAVAVAMEEGLPYNQQAWAEYRSRQEVEAV